MLGLTPEKTLGDSHQNVCGEGKKPSPTEPEKSVDKPYTNLSPLFQEKGGKQLSLRDASHLLPHTTSDGNLPRLILRLKINTQTLLWKSITCSIANAHLRSEPSGKNKGAGLQGANWVNRDCSTSMTLLVCHECGGTLVSFFPPVFN